MDRVGCARNGHRRLSRRLAATVFEKPTSVEVGGSRLRMRMLFHSRMLAHAVSVVFSKHLSSLRIHA